MSIRSSQSTQTGSQLKPATLTAEAISSPNYPVIMVSFSYHFAALSMHIPYIYGTNLEE